jgi:DNA-binding transcriptional ArsR family regulator
MKKLAYPHKCLSILGNELRTNILALLKDGELSVGELCNKLNEEQSKVSHALLQLKKCNFIDSKRSGKEQIYFIKSEVILKGDKGILDLIKGHVNKYCKVKKS